MSFTHRYAQYARLARGVGPEEALEADRREWPGGPMVGFSAWTRRAWDEFLRENPSVHTEFRTDRDHAAFDAWLASRDGRLAGRLNGLGVHPSITAAGATAEGLPPGVRVGPTGDAVDGSGDRAFYDTVEKKWLNVGRAPGGA